MNLWNRFRDGLTRTRARIEQQVGSLLGVREVDPETRERLEEALLGADVGPATVDRLLTRAEAMLRSDPTIDLKTALERTAAAIVGAKSARFEPGAERPWVALLVGVNGVGKTTLAGKLAYRFARTGHKTLLVAADTFRAAASEQLGVWAERAGVHLVRARDGADPAAVVHDALESARARGIGAVMIDTAGRLHTKHTLLEELAKIRRIAARSIPGAPHEVLLVLDAVTGMNGIAQAREFTKTVGVTGLVLTKMDGTAKGGVILAIVRELALPVRYVGVGETVDDLLDFDAAAFAGALVDD